MTVTFGLSSMYSGASSRPMARPIFDQSCSDSRPVRIFCESTRASADRMRSGELGVAHLQREEQDRAGRPRRPRGWRCRGRTRCCAPPRRRPRSWPAPARSGRRPARSPRAVMATISSQHTSGRPASCGARWRSSAAGRQVRRAWARCARPRPASGWARPGAPRRRRRRRGRWPAPPPGRGRVRSAPWCWSRTVCSDVTTPKRSRRCCTRAHQRLGPGHERHPGRRPGAGQAVGLEQTLQEAQQLVPGQAGDGRRAAPACGRRRGRGRAAQQGQAVEVHRPAPR